MTTYHNFLSYVILAQTWTGLSAAFMPESLYSPFEIAAKSSVYIDRTLIIKELFDAWKDGPTVLITMARLFGKTTNLDSVKRFFEIKLDRDLQPIEVQKSENLDLFSFRRFKITNDENFFRQHFGNYFVLFFSFAYGQIHISADAIIEATVKQMMRTFYKYKLILQAALAKEIDDDDRERIERLLKRTLSHDDVTRSISLLAKVMRMHYKKEIIVVIDDYDFGVMQAIELGIDAGKMSEFYHSLWTHTFQTSPRFVTYSLLTGRCNVAEFMGLTSVIGFQSFGFLEKRFSSYYLFTEADTSELFGRFEIIETEQKEILDYYKGYQIEDTQSQGTNPWTLIKCLTEKTFAIRQYWADTETIDGLQSVMSNGVLLQQCSKLLLHKTISFEFHRSLNSRDIELLRLYLMDPKFEKSTPEFQSDVVLSYLFQQGYISFTTVKNRFMIPNEEVRCEMERIMDRYFYKIMPSTKVVGLANGVLELMKNHFWSDECKFAVSAEFKNLYEKGLKNIPDDIVLHDDESAFQTITYYALVASKKFQLVVTAADLVEMLTKRTYRSSQTSDILFVNRDEQWMVIRIKFEKGIRECGGLDAAIRQWTHERIEIEEFIQKEVDLKFVMLVIHSKSNIQIVEGRV